MKAVTIAAGLFFFIYAPVSVFGQAGIITTHGGNGTAGYSGDGGPATSAQLNHPAGIALMAGQFSATAGSPTYGRVGPS